jgi:hypothetical protein
LWWRLRTLWRKDGASNGGWRAEKTRGIYSHGGQLREGRRSGERGEATDVSPIRVTSARWDGSHRMRAEGLSPCCHWVFGVRKRWGYIHGAQLAADLNWFALSAERRLIDFLKDGAKITNLNQLRSAAFFCTSWFTNSRTSCVYECEKCTILMNVHILHNTWHHSKLNICRLRIYISFHFKEENVRKNARWNTYTASSTTAGVCS